MKKILKFKTRNCIQPSFYCLIKNLSIKRLKNVPNLITQSEAPAQEVIVVDKLRTDISVDSILTGETISVLTGETRASVTPEERIPNRQKQNP